MNNFSFKNKLDILRSRASDYNHEKEKKIKSFALPDNWLSVGDYTFITKKVLKLPNFNSGLAFTEIVPSGFCLDDLLFFDLETTSLSCGAGNIFFLIGIGRIKKDKIEIEQIFLSDFPGETEFINYISCLFNEKYLYISYNGKSFDAHLLRSRFLLNGKKIKLNNQLDLLHLSRRFFKNEIGSCSLNNIEDKILGITRENDISGYDVPDIYFHFLRTGEIKNLLRVFYHNYQDILSLFYLFDYLLTITSKNNFKKYQKVDITALGEYFILNGHVQGTALLSKAFLENRIRAGEILSMYYKRCKMWNKAVGVWQSMAKKGKSFFAAIELAKYYEHQKKDFKRAFYWVKEAYRMNLELTQYESVDLLKRKRRLIRKMDKN